MLFHKVGTCLALAFLVTGTLAAGVARAATVDCGDVIVQDTTLDSDVGPCPDNGIIIGADAVLLDLGGHTVRGSGSGTGISSVRPGARIRNGSIVGFNQGVGIRTDSTVQQVTVTANRCFGIWMGLGADRNRISQTVVTGNGCGGVLILRSRFNAVTRTTVVGNAGPGVVIDSAGGLISRALGNSVFESTIYGNTGDGVYVSLRSDSTTVRSNSIVSNRGNGVYVVGSSGASISDNTIVGNSQNGVLVDRAAVPFPLASDNQVVRNTARTNGAPPASFDLADENPGCLGTVWSENQFLTRNQSCIN